MLAKRGVLRESMNDEEESITGASSRATIDSTVLVLLALSIFLADTTVSVSFTDTAGR